MISILALLVTGWGIGNLLLFFVGLVIACAIVYAIMRACDAPGWMYKVAAVLGLVLLLIIVIDFFFGGGGNGVITVH